MVRDMTFSSIAGPAVGVALVLAIVWAIVQLAPTAAPRWLGL